MTSVPEYRVTTKIIYKAICPESTCEKVVTVEAGDTLGEKMKARQGVVEQLDAHWRVEHSKVDHPMTILARWIDDPDHGYRFMLTNGTSVKYDRDGDLGGWPKVMKELVAAWRDAGYVD